MTVDRNQNSLSRFKNRFPKMVRFFGMWAVSFLSLSLWADTVILKNKTVHKGKVLSQDENVLKIKTNAGAELSLSKRNIMRVLYRDLNDQEVRKVIQEEEKKLPTKKETVTDIPTKKETIDEPPVKSEPPPEGFVRNKWNPTWRSALVPGWGFYYMDKNSGKEISWKTQWRPIALGVVTIVATGYVYRLRADAIAAQQEYEKNAILNLIPAKAGLDNQIDFGAALGFMYIYNTNIYNTQNTAIQKFNNTRNLGLLYIGQLVYTYWQAKKWEEEGVTKTEGAVFSGFDFQFSQAPDPLNNYQMQTNYKFLLSFKF